LTSTAFDGQETTPQGQRVLNIAISVVYVEIFDEKGMPRITYSEEKTVARNQLFYSHSHVPTKKRLFSRRNLNQNIHMHRSLPIPPIFPGVRAGPGPRRKSLTAIRRPGPVQTDRPSEPVRFLGSESRRSFRSRWKSKGTQLFCGAPVTPMRLSDKEMSSSKSSSGTMISLH
jgi:hypothetical protein